MKTKLLSIALLSVYVAVHAQDAQDPDPLADDGVIYVVPVNADGSVTAISDTDFQGEVALEADASRPGMHADGVSLQYGFIFYAENLDESKSTFYGLSGKNEELHFGERTRLYITNLEGSKTRYIAVEPGVYDITYFRPDATVGTSSFTITRNTPTGIATVTADSSEQPHYYDLGGRPVDAAVLTPGIYIFRHGTTAGKVLVR